MKKRTIIGWIAAASTLAYLLLRDEESPTPPIEGIKIDLEPEKIIESTLALTNIDPMSKENIKRFSQRAISRLYQR